jgi:hypothetical protein
MLVLVLVLQLRRESGEPVPSAPDRRGIFQDDSKCRQHCVALYDGESGSGAMRLRHRRSGRICVETA